jgi:hypothetical protein
VIHINDDGKHVSTLRGRLLIPAPFYNPKNLCPMKAFVSDVQTITVDNQSINVTVGELLLIPPMDMEYPNHRVVDINRFKKIYRPIFVTNEVPQDGDLVVSLTKKSRDMIMYQQSNKMPRCKKVLLTWDDLSPAHLTMIAQEKLTNKQMLFLVKEGRVATDERGHAIMYEACVTAKKVE